MSDRARGNRMELALTAERLRECLLYEPETGNFICLKSRRGVRARIGDVIGHLNDQGYIRIPLDGATYRAHRLAYFYMTGKWPANEMDHINGKRDDNRWANLREATRVENAGNTRGHGEHPKGVAFDKRRGRFFAHIRHNGKTYHLGCFDTADLAHAAYAGAAQVLRGEFARVA